jgi:hypothetical protein
MHVRRRDLILLRFSIVAIAAATSLAPLRPAYADPTQPLPPPPSPPPSPSLSLAPSPLATPQALPLTQPPLADTPATAPAPVRPEERVLHGFRIGYGYVMNYDKPAQAFNGQSLADKTGMRSPSHLLIGYEVMGRLAGHSWLNVILVGNVIIAGLEQSKFLPTANGLLGFEFNDSFQLGVGPSLQPLEGSYAHAIFAAGWTPRVGSFYVPVHAFFIPDVDGVNRMGVTTGVTW